MNNVIIAFIIVAALSIWLLGWWGIVLVAVFLLGAYGYSLAPRKKGRAERFIEKLGTDKK